MGVNDLRSSFECRVLACQDCGANTHFAARFLTLRRGQQLVDTCMLATMAPGLPYAIAAQLANPGRQVVAIVGDGGFAMLMSELSTAVKNHLPVKVIVMRNDMLAEVSHGHRGTGRPSRHVRLPRARVSQRVWKKSV
jgi:pyruvate dehydrogenase (quinone)